MSPPGRERTPAPHGGSLQTTASKQSIPLEDYGRRQARVRRCLYEVAVGILEDLDAGVPLGTISWTADARLYDAMVEVLAGALGDEEWLAA